MSVDEILAAPIVTTATIAASGNLSDAIDLQGRTLRAIQMPAAWTAANITLQASYDGTTYANVYDDGGNEYTITAAQARFILVDPNVLVGVRRLKVRSGTGSVPVAQAAERALQLITT